MNRKYFLVAALIVTSSQFFFRHEAKASATQAPEASKDEMNVSVFDVPLLKPAYITTSPTPRKDGLTTGSLGGSLGNHAMIKQLAQEIANEKHGKFDSLLIMHQGKLVFESYYNRGRINLPHPQASASKAYTALAVGRAIQLGYLSKDDLHKPLIKFLHHLEPSKLVAGAEKITLHQALTMRSGIRIPDAAWDEYQNNAEQFKGQQQVQHFLQISAPITAESQTFKYQYDPTLVMQVLEAVVPGSAEEFITKELFAKLGITHFSWRKDSSGLLEGGSGARLTSRDMLKVGRLVQNQGKWLGETLIAADFIKTATGQLFLTGDDDVHFGGKDVFNQGYAYYWWSAEMRVGDKTYFARSAQGGYGQLIVLIEELDLMIVTTGLDNDAAYLQIIAERILPAFIQ